MKSANRFAPTAEEPLHKAAAALLVQGIPLLILVHLDVGLLEAPGSHIAPKLAGRRKLD
jgi:hypothetical protein